jgi:hypothetical protein
MTAQRPYAHAARGYRHLGWINPIPVKGKHPPVTGYTGYDGADVTDSDVTRWRAGEEGRRNIGLRLHDGVIGIDVDAYDGKQGAGTLAKAEAELGELPPTWSSTSRGPGQPSRIYLYRVPEGLDWSGAERNLGRFGAAIDVLHRGHRYAMVAPSIHPDTGKGYRCYDPAGVVSGAAPRPEDLTWLPPAWVEDLTRPAPPAAASAEPDEGSGPKHEGIIPYSERHNALVSYAGRLRNLGLSYNEAKILFRRRWLDCVQPPGVEGARHVDPSCPKAATWDDAVVRLDDVWERYPAGHAEVTDAPEPLPTQQAGTKPSRPRPPTLVDGFLRQGEMLVFGAARGIGKSWWGMDLARHLARGEGRFMGAHAVRQRARVLYCHGEGDDWDAYDRWERLAGNVPGLLEPPPALRETFEPWRIRIVRRRVTCSGDGVSTSTEQLDAVLDPRLEQAIVAEQIEVLIVDPWIVFYAGRENANDEVEMALATLRRLQLAHGLTIVVLHHFGKANDTSRDPEDLWRGASRLADWASTRVTLLPFYTPAQVKAQGMTRHQARRYARVTFLRRSAAPPEDLTVRWTPETGQWERWQAPEGAGGTVAPTPADVAAKCPTPDGWPSVLAAAAALDVSEGTARKLLERAKAQGLLEDFTGLRNARGWRVPGSKPEGTDVRS